MCTYRHLNQNTRQQFSLSIQYPLKSTIASFSSKHRINQFPPYLRYRLQSRTKRKRSFTFWWRNLKTHQRLFFRHPHRRFPRSPKCTSFDTRPKRRRCRHLKQYPNLVAITENKSVEALERRCGSKVGECVEFHRHRDLNKNSMYSKT